MFFDSEVLNSNSLKNAWRAANKQDLCPENVPLPKVCKLLDSWIASDYQDPCRRMSLRTSSILVDGAAKLYHQGLNDLLKDLNSEEFEQSNDNESSPGHSASTVKSDSFDFDIYKSGKSKKNDMSDSRRNHCKKKNNNSLIITSEARQNKSTSNEEFPIGQIFIYENHMSKVPSKIIIGKINSDVKKNIKF
ncbi:uncharacterized protein LOC128679409 isoform X2 [Plodia interpunctella]|uniref:uncharacterized protein LOC128679409 isoform X2 n=1 Tax=Plodia interpunctella TaxID=58824 RepID=UPI00236834B0|nr:uncharacterized protein LOC128679409 isoform X2 [Plodia interpunctella]